MSVRFDRRSAAICFAVNAAFGAWSYRFLPALPLWTSWGIASDTLIGSAVLALACYATVTPLVRALPGRAPAPGSALARFARLPSFARAGAFVLAALALFALPLCALLAWLLPDGMAYGPFVAFKASAGGVLGGLLVPFIADAAADGNPTLVKAVPRFPVLDLKMALDFYERRLGFTKLFEWDGYAGVARAAFELHLFQMDDPKLPEWTSCRVNVVGVDALYAEFERAGVIHPNGALANRPWGFREFTVLDLCGNAIVFGERIG